MKLNISPRPVHLCPAPEKKATGWESPIGWWRVTTEADEEGRTTEDFGEFYGHIAEIAFSLADKVYYTLRFSPVFNCKDKPKVKSYLPTAAKNEVWISFDKYGLPINAEIRAAWAENFLDARESIRVKSTDGNARYYAGVFLQLNID